MLRVAVESVTAPLRPVPVPPLQGPLSLYLFKGWYLLCVGECSATAQQVDRDVVLILGERIGLKIGTDLPNVGNCCRVHRTAEDRHCERRHGCRFDLGVETLVVAAETLVVAAVAWLGGTIDSYDQTRADVRLTANSTADLDVLGCRLGLSDDGHQAQAINVDADLNDVRCQADVDAAGLAVRELQLLDGLWYLVAAAAAS